MKAAEPQLELIVAAPARLHEAAQAAAIRRVAKPHRRPSCAAARAAQLQQQRADAATTDAQGGEAAVVWDPW